MTAIETAVALVLFAIGYAWGNRAEPEHIDEIPLSIEPGMILQLPRGVELVHVHPLDTDSTGCRS